DGVITTRELAAWTAGGIARIRNTARRTRTANMSRLAFCSIWRCIGWPFVVLGFLSLLFCLLDFMAANWLQVCKNAGAPAEAAAREGSRFGSLPVQAHPQVCPRQPLSAD